MESEEKSAWRAIVLAVFAIAVGAYAVLYGLQTLAVVSASSWERAHPELGVVPQPLPDTSVSSGKPTKVESFGYKFDAPWADFDKVDPGLGYATFSFRSGQRIIFFDPSAQTDTVRVMNAADPERFRKSTIAFGGGTFDSNYGLYLSVFSASPAQLSAFMPLPDSVRIRALLLWKESLSTNLEMGLYSLELHGLRGFQRGDAARARYVLVRAFDPQDHQFEFIFAARPDATVKLTQADINRVSATLRPEWLPDD